MKEKLIMICLKSVKKMSLMHRIVSLPAEIRFRDLEIQIMFISLLVTRVSLSPFTKISMDGNK
jgi:aryl carrier-like protein